MMSQESLKRSFEDARLTGSFGSPLSKRSRSEGQSTLSTELSCCRGASGKSTWWSLLGQEEAETIRTILRKTEASVRRLETEMSPPSGQIDSLQDTETPLDHLVSKFGQTFKLEEGKDDIEGKSFQSLTPEAGACHEKALLARAVQCLIENVYEPLHDKLDSWEWKMTSTIRLENEAIALACPEWKIQGHHYRCQTQKFDLSVPKVDDIVKFLEGCSEPKGTADLTPELIRCIATQKWRNLRHELRYRKSGSTLVLEALDKLVMGNRDKFSPSRYMGD